MVPGIFPRTMNAMRVPCIGIPLQQGESQELTPLRPPLDTLDTHPSTGCFASARGGRDGPAYAPTGSPTPVPAGRNQMVPAHIAARRQTMPPCALRDPRVHLAAD